MRGVQLRSRAMRSRLLFPRSFGRGRGSDCSYMPLGRYWLHGPVELPEMPAPPRKRPLGPCSAGHSLWLLVAGIPFGATDAAISANGITRETLVSLIRRRTCNYRARLRLAGKLSAASGSLRPVSGR
jgi:hypothetical protein